MNFLNQVYIIEGLAVLSAILTVIQYGLQRHLEREAHGRVRSDAALVASTVFSLVLVFLVTRAGSLIAAVLIVLLTILAVFISYDDWQHENHKLSYKVGLTAVSLDIVLTLMIVMFIINTKI